MNIAHWGNADISDKAHHWLMRLGARMGAISSRSPWWSFIIHFATWWHRVLDVPTFQLIAGWADYADEHRAWSAWLGSGRATRGRS